MTPAERNEMAIGKKRIVLNAVRRMLPRSALGRDMMRKLKVYAGPDHPHVAQKPEPLKLSL